MEVRLRYLTTIRKLLLLISLIYCFLVSIELMSSSFKLFGEGFARQLIATTSNPFTALFIGILATTIMQSSSSTTSILVGLVAGGGISVANAIPIVMGANIGTSVTNTIVSFTHITRRQEFRRAFAGATVHDFFNILAVMILLPLEICTHFLESSASILTNIFVHIGGIKFTSPLKTGVRPVVAVIKSNVQHLFPDSTVIPGVVMLLIALVLLFISLKLLVNTMRWLVLGRIEKILHGYLFERPMRSLLLGMAFTSVVQSSSVTTSLIVPLVGAGILTVEEIFPYTLGANIGTTVTAILASLVTGSSAAIAIALTHLLFNISGMAIFYPLRKLPIGISKELANFASNSRKYALLYIVVVFYLFPILLIYLTGRGG